MLNLLNKTSKNQVINILLWGLILIVGLVLIVKFRSIQKTFPLVIVAIYIISKQNQKSYNLSYLDIGFVLLFVSEIIATLTSVYFVNSLSSLLRLVVLLFLYIIYKILVKKEVFRDLIPILFFCFSSLLIILNIGSFLSYNRSLNSFGFFELNDFKNLYFPLEIVNDLSLNNLWVSALLIFIPLNLVFLLRQKKKEVKFLAALMLFLNIFCIIVSFSRGAYLSLFAFIISLNIFIVRLVKFKRLFFYNLIAFILLSLSALLVKDSFYTTISYNKTESQQRSLDGRVLRWQNTMHLIKKKPITGYGHKNYGLVREEYPMTHEEVSNFKRVNNTFLQILFERGILGFSIYFIFFIIITYIFLKRIKSKQGKLKDKVTVAIIYSGILAFLVRETTFSSLLDSNMVYFVAFYLVFALVPYDEKVRTIRVTKWKKLSFVIFCTLLVSGLLYFNTRRLLMVENNNKSVRNYFSGNIHKSIYYIDKALYLNPDDFYLNKHRGLAILKNSFYVDISAKNEYLVSIDSIDQHALNSSLIYFEKCQNIKPFDDEIYHAMGWIYFMKENNQFAKSYFEKSLELDPYNSLYHISLALYKIKNQEFEEAVYNVSEALRYSPDILESRFYSQLEEKFASIASESKQKSISKIKTQLKEKDDLILKARLARLLLDSSPGESLRILSEVSSKLPNLDRPWAYMAYLKNNIGDSFNAHLYLQKSVFLNKSDFLPKLYLGKYNMSTGRDDEAILWLKKAIKSYEYSKYNFYNHNSISTMNVIPTSYFLSDLLYCLEPQIEASVIFEYFADYYEEHHDSDNYLYYNQLAMKYKNRLFKGEVELP